MNYKIITDTCCDLPDTMYKELGLEVVPLSVLYKGQTYNTYTEQWLKDLFEGLRQGEVATTSAVNPDQWARAIEPVLEAGQDALVLAFSSGLSTTYQSAVIAAQDLKDRNIMDCMECRCCEYICSSKIPLVTMIKMGKNAVRGMK